MPERIIIAAQTENRVIGRENAMPWHLPRDLQHFKRHTLGHPVIMGRNTYLSMGKALPGRDNLVVSRSVQTLPDAAVFPSLMEALNAAQGEKIFIMGGAQIYAQALAENLADTLLITWIHTQLDGEHLFPEINPARWQEVARERIPADDNNAYDMSFVQYRKI